MYDNIGEKIKAVAVAGCILGIIASLIVGIPLIANADRYNPTATMGWVNIIVGSLASWLGSFCLYGFGELIEKTGANNEALVKIEKELAALNAKSGAERENRPEEATRVAEARRHTEEAARVEEVRKSAEEQDQRKAPEAKNAQGVPSYPHTLEYYGGICPNCGFEKNRENRVCCFECGAKFASREN